MQLLPRRFPSANSNVVSALVCFHQSYTVVRETYKTANETFAHCRVSSSFNNKYIALLYCRDEPASKKAKKENGAAGDPATSANSTGSSSTQQIQSTASGQNQDQSGYNYYGGQWGGHYVSSVISLHCMLSTHPDITFSAPFSWTIVSRLFTTVQKFVQQLSRQRLLSCSKRCVQALGKAMQVVCRASDLIVAVCSRKPCYSFGLADLWSA